MEIDRIETKEDIKHFLTSRIAFFDGESDTRYGDWTPIAGFRRAFNDHTVWKNNDTDIFAFHVDMSEYGIRSFPNFGEYTSYEELIDGVAEKYESLWNSRKTLNVV